MNENQTISLESEAGFKALFQYATIGIIVIGSDGRIELANPCIEKLFDYTNAELIGQQVEILIPQALRRRHEHHRDEYFKRPKARSMGYGLNLFARRKDGFEFPVEISLGHYRLGSERLAVAFITDITERKKADEDLKNSEERYRLIFDGIHESFILQEIITNDKGEIIDLRYLEVNPASEKILGKTSVELIGCMRSEVLGPLDIETKKIVEQAVKMDEPLRIERYVPSLDRWLDVSIFCPKPGQLAILNRDITERKNAEDELLKSQDILAKEAEALAHLNESGNRLWSMNNLQQGLEEMLSASIKLMGADKGLVQLVDNEKQTLSIAAHFGFGQEFLDYFHELTAIYDSASGKAFNTKKQITIEDIETDILSIPYREIAQKAGFRAVQTTPLYAQDGSPIGMISTHFRNPHSFSPQDLNRMELYARKAESFIERHKMFEAMQRLNLELDAKVTERTKELITSLEREKELNELKSRFVSMASHEFRTPLSAILSSISLIDSYQKEEQAEKRKKHTERIKASVRNLVDILNDFLSLDKLEQGKVEIKTAKIDLPEFAEDIIEEVSGMLKQGQKINFSHNGEKEIVQDRKVLKNILLNLLSNAIKYSLENKEIYFLMEVHKDLVSIKVKDEGIGIPEEDQENLFGKFFRAKNATNISGTGLGLNIVKKYVELLDGNISFISKYNEGTTFTVELPNQLGVSNNFQ